ncbi:MAG: hypothetical protein ACKOXF_08780, partial [Chitinophagaceae bacterium]
IALGFILSSNITFLTAQDNNSKDYNLDSLVKKSIFSSKDVGLFQNSFSNVSGDSNKLGTEYFYFDDGEFNANHDTFSLFAFCRIVNQDTNILSVYIEIDSIAQRDLFTHKIKIYKKNNTYLVVEFTNIIEPIRSIEYYVMLQYFNKNYLILYDKCTNNIGLFWHWL